MPRPALALLVARITGTDDPDLAVTFDDLAEFASALYRRSHFHSENLQFLRKLSDNKTPTTPHLLQITPFRGAP